MGRKPKAPDLEAIRARLRDAGLRSTGPRVAVLAHLLGAPAPVSHAELCDALDGSGFDRATLYRNLIDLADAGLLSRGDLGDHVWRFELRRGGAEEHPAGHAHFTCTDCGEVACLPGVRVRLEAGAGAPRAVVTSAVQVQLRGRCDACA